MVIVLLTLRPKRVTCIFCDSAYTKHAVMLHLLSLILRSQSLAAWARSASVATPSLPQGFGNSGEGTDGICQARCGSFLQNLCPLPLCCCTVAALLLHCCYTVAALPTTSEVVVIEFECVLVVNCQIAQIELI